MKNFLGFALVGSLTVVGGGCRNNDSNGSSATSDACKTGPKLFVSGYETNAVGTGKAKVSCIDTILEKDATVFPGESGDAMLMASGDEVLLFNRMGTLNYKSVSEQTKAEIEYKSGKSGDPADVYALGDGLMLLAHHIEGSLVITRQATGEKVQSITADWDLPTGVTLRPESLIPVKNAAGREFIYVVHQGVSASFEPNGTQTVFILSKTGSTLSVFDNDDTKEKIQGIPLKGSFPIPVRHAGRAKPMFVSMCAKLATSGTGTSGTSGTACVAAIEEVDPETNTASTIWDLAEELDMSMNGGVQPSDDAESFFAQVTQKDGDTTVGRYVKIVPAAHSVTTVYTYTSVRNGYLAALYNSKDKTVLVGDSDGMGKGLFKVFKASDISLVKTISLPLEPYSAILDPVTNK